MEDVTDRVKMNTFRLVGGIIFLLSFGFVIFTFTVTKGAGLMLTVSGVCCLLAAFYSLVLLGKAQCPKCGRMVSNLGLKNNPSIECPGCGDYFYTRDGTVIPTAADSVEASPVFSTACPTDIVWPPGCAVCGNDVTNHAPVQLQLEDESPVAMDMLTNAASFKLVSKRKFEVGVPVCDDHSDNCAELVYKYEEEQLHIKFRSRPYASAFAEANGPVDS